MWHEGMKQSYENYVTCDGLCHCDEHIHKSSFLTMACTFCSWRVGGCCGGLLAVKDLDFDGDLAVGGYGRACVSPQA